MLAAKVLATGAGVGVVVVGVVVVGVVGVVVAGGAVVVVVVVVVVELTVQLSATWAEAWELATRTVREWPRAVRPP
jgi:hypothetical protein